MKKILRFCVTTVLLLGVLLATMPSCTRDDAYSPRSGQMDENEASDAVFELLNAQLDEYDASFVSAEISWIKRRT